MKPAVTEVLEDKAKSTWCFHHISQEKFFSCTASKSSLCCRCCCCLGVLGVVFWWNLDAHRDWRPDIQNAAGKGLKQPTPVDPVLSKCAEWTTQSSGISLISMMVQSCEDSCYITIVTEVHILNRSSDLPMLVHQLPSEQFRLHKPLKHTERRHWYKRSVYIQG